jgi:hypothetical protein
MTHPLHSISHIKIPRPLRHTVDSIDLYQVLEDRLIDTRPRPVKGNSIGFDACEGDGGRIWDFDT